MLLVSLLVHVSYTVVDACVVKPAFNFNNQLRHIFGVSYRNILSNIKIGSP